MVRSYRRSASSVASRRRRERRLLHSSSTSALSSSSLNNDDVNAQTEQIVEESNTSNNEVGVTSSTNTLGSKSDSATTTSTIPNNGIALIEELASIGYLSSTTSNNGATSEDKEELVVPSNEGQEQEHRPSVTFTSSFSSEATTVVMYNTETIAENQHDNNSRELQTSLNNDMLLVSAVPTDNEKTKDEIDVVSVQPVPHTIVSASASDDGNVVVIVPTHDDDAVQAETSSLKENGDNNGKDGIDETSTTMIVREEGDLFGNLWGFVTKTTGSLAEDAIKLTVTSVINVCEHPTTHHLLQQATTSFANLWEHPIVSTQRQNLLHHTSSVIVPIVTTSMQIPIIDHMCQTSMNIATQHVLPLIDGLLQGVQKGILKNERNYSNVPALPPLSIIPENDEGSDLLMTEESTRIGDGDNSFYIRCDDIPTYSRRITTSKEGSSPSYSIPRQASPMSVLDVDTENKNAMHMTPTPSNDEKTPSIEDDKKKKDLYDKKNKDLSKGEVQAFAPGPDLTKWLVVKAKNSYPQKFSISFELDCFLDALCHRALNYCCVDETQQLYNYVEWEAESSTKKVLDKVNKGSSLDNKSLLLWMGKMVTTEGDKTSTDLYGNGIPLFKARGIVENMSSKQLVDLLWNNDNVHKYNRWIIERQNIAMVDDENCSSSNENDQKKKTKMIRSISKLPFTTQRMVLTNLMHTRKLDDEEETYLIVTRSIATSYDTEEEGGNEVIFGINYIRPVKDDCSGINDDAGTTPTTEKKSNRCEMIAVSHMRANFAPNFLKKKVGFTGLTQFFDQLRAHAASTY